MSFKVVIPGCRVCMKNVDGISILKDHSIQEKFVYTTKLKVQEDDSMPNTICPKCVSQLKVAYDFCRQANSSEKQLRKFISNVSDEFKKVTKLKSNEDDERTFLMEEDDENVNIFIEDPEEEEASFLEENEPKQEKGEHIDLAVEPEPEPESHDQIITKQEVYESEIYMEEFNEIIQDEEDNGENLYLDEELQLYEENESQILNEEDKSMDVEETHMVVQEVLSGLEEENHIKCEEQKPKRKKTSRTKKSGGESPAVRLEGKTNICIKCNKDFSTKTNLMRHMSTHDGVKPYQCTVCGKGFTQNGSLKQHMFIHTGERPHVCSVCMRGFTQSKSLIFHMRRHTGEKPFTCEECGINFRQKDGLKHHVQKYHNGTTSAASTDRYVCVVCDRVLATKYSLSVHMKKHSDRDQMENGENDEEETNEKVIKARSKSRANSDSPELVSESTTDTQIENVVHLSSNAGAGFRTKQFQCGKCFKSFHIKLNLLRHLRNHDVSTLELHECEDCLIGFDTKRSLKLHRLRDHKDLIPDLNSCEHCNAPFDTVGDLSEHIATVHDSIDEDCPHCNEHFKSQKLYYDHLLEHEHMLGD